MSLSPLLEGLLALSKIDERASVAAAELTGLNQELGVLREGEASLRSVLEGTERALGDAEKARADAHQELRSTSNQIEQSREKMSRVRTERENNAVGRELEELRRIVRDQEDEMRKLDVLIGEYREKIALTRTEMDKASEDLGGKSGTIGARVNELEASLAELQSQRAEAAKVLPPALARKYETIKQKRGSAVATTTDGTCTACHIALPPQLFHTLRRAAVHEQCPSCNRIIFYVPPPAAPPST